jgi:hypothetical protein
MTAILRACLIYWPVTLLGLLGTGGLIFWSAHPTPVYFSQTNVVFFAPISAKNPNALMISSDSLISMAGIIQREVDQGNAAARTSGKVTLVDQGIYQGMQVKVPHSGGQWQHIYDEPVLDLEVTGADPDEVRQRVVAVRQQIVNLLDAKQEQAGVAQRNLIRVRMLPSAPSVDLVSGRRIRAIGVSGLLGVSITFAVCAIVAKLHYMARHRSKLDEITPVTAAHAASISDRMQGENSPNQRADVVTRTKQSVGS